MEPWAIFDRIRTTLATARRANPGSRYRAVQVNASSVGCCDAVRAIADKRFLSHEVPKLPLRGCDAALCRCNYQLFEDRRSETRRKPEARPGFACQLRTWDDRSPVSWGRRRDD